MSFDDRDIRRGMDVFTPDNVLIGTVVWIRRGRPVRSGEAGALAEAGMSGETRATIEETRQSSAVNGELLGPMPTASVGNGGPAMQGARSRFAARPDRPDRAGRPLDGAELLVLRTPIGLDLRHPLPRLRRVPLTAVQTVSLERIVLRVTEAELDAGPG